MKTYGALVCLLLVAEVGTAIAIYVFKGQVLDLTGSTMSKTQINYKADGYVSPTQTWDELQMDFQCCGVYSYKDWDNATVLKTTQSVPDTCCKTKADDCGKGVQGESESVAEGK